MFLGYFYIVFIVRRDVLKAYFYKGIIGKIIFFFLF